jgi:hypothetical protein
MTEQHVGIADDEFDGVVDDLRRDAISANFVGTVRCDCGLDLVNVPGFPD